MPSSTKYTAPKLVFNGAKEQDNEKTNQFYQQPQRLMDIIFNLLDGKAAAQIKIMAVLVGTKEKFEVHENWICKRTGLTSSSYTRARNELQKRGWISHTAYKTIIINFDKIYEDGRRELPLEDDDEIL